MTTKTKTTPTYALEATSLRYAHAAAAASYLLLAAGLASLSVALTTAALVAAAIGIVCELANF